MFNLLGNMIANTIVGFLIACIVVIAYIAFYYRDKYLKTNDELLDLASSKKFFSKKASVMRDDERKIFDILMNLYADKYYIFPQMSLSNVLEVIEEMKDHDNLYREIDNRSLDFVLYDKTQMSPVLAIELNGESLRKTKKNKGSKRKNL